MNGCLCRLFGLAVPPGGMVTSNALQGIRVMKAGTCLIMYGIGLRDCAAIGQITQEVVMPAKAGIQKYLIIPDSP